MRPGESFENETVVRNYLDRPDYPLKIYERLAALSRSTTNALDLGCGTGKVARGIAGYFNHVTAVDASAAMLSMAREQSIGTQASNITWVHSLAESAHLDGPFDLIVAAASIHWMRHEALFPRLLQTASADHAFAVVDGDGAYQPPWQQGWEEFLGRWIPRLSGEAYEPERQDTPFNRHMVRYRDWLEIDGETTAKHTVSQSIERFIRCQHSRDTFAPHKMGAQIELFDQELDDLLRPFADEDGCLTYLVRTRLEWGRIRL